MNFIDIILVCFLLIAMIKGYRRGLWMSVISILSLFLGLIIGVALIEYAQQAWGWQKNNIGYFVALFILTYILYILFSTLIGKGIRGLLRKTPLAWVDAWLGAGFSVVLWGVFWGGIAIILGKINAMRYIEKSYIALTLHSTTLSLWAWLAELF